MASSHLYLDTDISDADFAWDDSLIYCSLSPFSPELLDSPNTSTGAVAMQYPLYTVSYDHFSPIPSGYSQTSPFSDLRSFTSDTASANTTPPSDHPFCPTTRAASHDVRGANETGKTFPCLVCAGKNRKKVFNSRSDLARHQKTVHHLLETGDCVWKCALPGCVDKDRLWPRLDNFKEHIRRMHGMMDDSATVGWKLRIEEVIRNEDI